jgi:DNA-binding MarR family transcriptional regulator
VNEMDALPGADGPQWIERAEQILVHARRLRELLEEQAGRHGLSEPELALLWACAKSPPGGRSQCELAEELAVSSAQVSGLVERMCRVGLLRARAVEEDRRRHLWELAPAGVVVWQAVLNGLTEAVEHRGAA